MNIIDTNLTSETEGKSSFSHTSARSRLAELIEQRQLTDLIELTGLHGENALFAIAAIQCWLCGGTQSKVVPAIAPDLKPSCRCASCDCFLEVAQ